MSRRDFIVSGTRTELTAADKAWIRGALVEFGVDDSESRDVLHHGACPTGVDRFVHMLAQSWPLQVKPWPADWNMHGRKAGPLRNRQMVGATEPNMCFAFPRKGEPNKGTRDFIVACLEFQVDVQVFWLEESE